MNRTNLMITINTHDYIVKPTRQPTNPPPQFQGPIMYPSPDKKGIELGL